LKWLVSLFGALLVAPILCLVFLTPSIVMVWKLGAAGVGTWWFLEAVVSFARNVLPLDSNKVGKQRTLGRADLLVSELLRSAFAVAAVLATARWLIAPVAPSFEPWWVIAIATRSALLAVTNQDPGPIAGGATQEPSELRSALTHRLRTLFALVVGLVTPAAVAFFAPSLPTVIAVSAFVALALAVWTMPRRGSSPLALPWCTLGVWVPRLAEGVVEILIGHRYGLVALAGYIAVTHINALLFVSFMVASAGTKFDRFERFIRGLVLAAVFILIAINVGPWILEHLYPAVREAGVWFPVIAWFGLALLPVSTWGLEELGRKVPDRFRIVFAVIYLAVLVILVEKFGIEGSLYAKTIGTTLSFTANPLVARRDKTA
jgi:hypothetical protein